MTKIQIRKVNGVPMGRPKNPYIRIEPSDANEESYDWYAFEQSVTEHEAPGFEEGEAEGVLIWQDRFLKGRWADSVGNERNSNPESETRQIWIVSTPEKAEVKEAKSLIIESVLIHEIPAISKRTGISTEWLAVWYEVEMFYGDVQKKETREDLLLRLQTQYKLTAV